MSRLLQNKHVRTFLISAAIPAGLILGSAMMTFDQGTLENWRLWVRALMVAEVTAFGRQLIAFLGSLQETPAPKMPPPSDHLS